MNKRVNRTPQQIPTIQVKFAGIANRFKIEAQFLKWQVQRAYRLLLSRPADKPTGQPRWVTFWAETPMVQIIVLSMMLSVGQADIAPCDSNPVSPASSTMPSDEPFWLMRTLQGTQSGQHIEQHRLQISGWTEASFTASSARYDQLPMGFNYRANEFLLQQNWLRIERTIDTSNTASPSFGFRTDTILPGSDYRFTVARGLWSGQLTANNGEPNNYGIDPVQFYGEALFSNVGEGLNIKIGRMYCQYGTESIDAPSNLLVSHSYLFMNDPFTQTGVMGTLQLNKTWSIQLGTILGPDVFIDPAASPYGMFSVKWAPPEGTDTVQVSGLFGSGRYNVTEQFNNPNIIDFVFTHKFSTDVTYTMDALFGYQDNVPEIGTAVWYGIVNYLTCPFTAQLNGTTRLEFFDDVDGNRTGYAGLYTAITAGLNWKWRPGIIFRPELRFDYNGSAQPFDGQHGLFTATTDVIVRW